MTARRPRPATPNLLPQEKSVPYPPAAIWKTKEEGVGFEFRGNMFERRGMYVARVAPGTAPQEPAAKPKTGSE